MPTGDLAGSLESLNRRNERGLVHLEEDEVELSPEGEEILETFELKRRMLDDQLAHMWKKPYLTADGVLIEAGKVLLVRRGREPEQGMLALPGGILEYGEKLEECVVREVREETGIETRIKRMVGVLSDPDRDPRGHFVTVVYELERTGGELIAGDDAADAGFFPVQDLPPLAFDHARIIKRALKGDGEVLPEQKQ